MNERIDVEALRGPFNFGRCLMSAHALCPSSIKSHPDRMGWMGNYVKDQLRMQGFDVDSGAAERRARDTAVAELVAAIAHYRSVRSQNAIDRLDAALAAIQGATP